MRQFFKTSSHSTNITFPSLNPLTKFPTDQFTLSAWLKFIPDPHYASDPSKLILLSYNVEIEDSGVTFSIRDLTNLTVEYNGVKQSSGINISDGNWYHFAVAVTFPSTTQVQANLFINGNLRQTLTIPRATDAVLPRSGQFVVGGLLPSLPQAAFNGLITQVQLWTLEQTAQQIQTNFLMPTPLDKDGLHLFWPLNNPQDIGTSSDGRTVVLDRSANNFNGFLINGPTWIDSPWYDLSNWELPDHNLRGADFNHAILNQTNFMGSYFTDADLSFAKLNNPNLTQATFDNTKMNGTTFTNTNLTQTIFASSPPFSNDPQTPTHLISSTILFSSLGSNWSNLTMEAVSIASLPRTLPNINATNATITNLNLSNYTLTNPNFSNATLTDVNFTNTTLINPTFDKATLTGVNFTNTKIIGAQFTNTDLTQVTFKSPPTFSQDPNTPTSFANSTLNSTFIQKNWVNFDLGNATIKDLPQDLSNLNATGANLANFSFVNHTLTQAIFDRANLTNTSFANTTLTQSSFIGAILTNANLAGTTLTSANFSGAQLGAKEAQFPLSLDYVNELNNGRISANLQQTFAANNHPLDDTATATCRIPNQNWLIQYANTQFDVTRYQQNLKVSTYTDIENAAVLTNAYMPDANFSNANLYAVNMDSVQWYGANAKADNADLELTIFSQANLGSIDLSQAKLYGAILSNAILTNANLSGAFLTPSHTAVATDFTGANLQGTNFTEAQLGNAILTRAAIALTNGVPLFRITTPNIADLNQNTISASLKTQFTNHGYPLTPTVSLKTITPNSHWQIRQSRGNTDQLGVRYATFNLVIEADQLQIYGASLWIRRLGDNNKLQIFQITIAPTTLAQKSLNGNTMMPNNRRFSTFPANGLTWQQMLTSTQPPSPPACVPTPTKWCPPA